MALTSELCLNDKWHQTPSLWPPGTLSFLPCFCVLGHPSWVVPTGSLTLWLWLSSGKGTPLQEVRRKEESAARVSSPQVRPSTLTSDGCAFVTTGPARWPSPDSGSNHSLLFLLLLRDGHSPHVLPAPGYCTILCGVLAPPPHSSGYPVGVCLLLRLLSRQALRRGSKK